MEQELKSLIKENKNLIVRFSIVEGCHFCDDYKPIFDEFEKQHPEIKCHTIWKKTLQEPRGVVGDKYNIERYPAIVTFVDGRFVAKEYGGLSEEKLLQMLKTVQNISDYELQEFSLEIQGKVIELNKELLKLTKTQEEINNEVAVRLSKRNQPELVDFKPEDCKCECETTEVDLRPCACCKKSVLVTKE